VASRDPALTLGLWFGADALQALRAQPDPVGCLRAALDRDIAALDAKLSRQLDAVLTHPRLAKLEGAWRGLAWLVQHVPQTGSRTLVKILPARWAEICRDLERAVEFDQSHLFRKVHEEQFGMAGGEPFGLLACDYEVRHRPSREHPTDDVAAIQGLAGIAAAAFAPMLLGASPDLLGLGSFADMSPSFDPASALQSTEHLRWRQSLTREDMRFVAVALPRVLGRAPWADDSSRVDRFRYLTCPPKAAQRVWTSAVYGFAAVAVRAFDRYSWPAEVRGADIADEPGGGVLEDLPFERFASDLPFEPPARAPLELALTDDQENQLGEAGLVALAALEGLSEACFGALPSLHKPPRQRTEIADANQRISSQFNTLLCVSRFAHCVKMMGRDMIGSYMEPAEVEKRLQDWLSGYVSGGILSAETTAKYPLLDARVEVRERRGQPGVFNCTVHLRPQHQLDDVGASFRLVTEFAPRHANA
jgi:type VI secretion system protein ImpD/type VI secretion system protein ImpC